MSQHTIYYKSLSEEELLNMQTKDITNYVSKFFSENDRCVQCNKYLKTIKKKDRCTCIGSLHYHINNEKEKRRKLKNREYSQNARQRQNRSFDQIKSEHDLLKEFINQSIKQGTIQTIPKELQHIITSN